MIRKRRGVAIGVTSALVVTALVVYQYPLLKSHWNSRKFSQFTKAKTTESATTKKGEVGKWTTESLPESGSLDSKAHLSDSNELEDSFLVLTEALETAEFLEKDETIRSAQHLLQALAWKENPARSQVLLQWESLVWNFIRVSGSRAAALENLEKDPAKKKLFAAFRVNAEDEIEKLKNENPDSVFIKVLESI